MSGRIPPIRIPSPVVRTLPPPVTESMAPPVVRGISPPVVNIPDTSIDYPTIDIQTEQQFEADLSQPQEVDSGVEEATRGLPPNISVGNLDIPVPPMDVVVTAGASAVVATTVSLGAAVAFNQLKNATEPFMRELFKPKKSKAKIKQKKPVLHFVESRDGSIDVLMYSVSGVEVVDNIPGSLESYLRDQIEMNFYYEYDNKLIIDDKLSDKFTKEGVKRFKNHFTPAKVIVKKLSAKFSF